MPIAEIFDRLVAQAVERGTDSAVIATALDQATEAAADVLTQRLQADAPRMLREHRDFMRGFEQRLQHRRGPALDLYECVRVCCLEAGEDFQKRQSQQTDGSSLKRSALTLLHARACVVAFEVQGLFRSAMPPVPGTLPSSSTGPTGELPRAAEAHSPAKVRHRSP